MNNETKDILLKELNRQNLPIMGNLIANIIHNISNIDLLNTLLTTNNITTEETIIKTNTIENIYGIVENLAAPVIKKIINNDIETFSMNEYQNIFRYALYQLTRTPKIKNNKEDELNHYGLKVHRFLLDLKSNLLQHHIS